jgi:periplasmic protein TonB
MATCDHPSDLGQRIAYPSLHRPGLRIDFRVAALLEEEKRDLPVPSSQQGIEECSLFREIESGAKLKRNPLAGAGALVLQCLFLAAVVVVPLLRTVPLPKRETVTMLYLQPPAGPAGGATKFRAPTTPRPSIATPTSTSILAPVHKTQEVAPPPVGATSGVVGGVPGGMVGGVSGGVFNGMLNSAPSVPVLAKTSVAAPVKRIRVAARVAEANLIRDVSPQYPPEAGRARLEGTVVLMAVIDKDGSVKDVRVESGLPILAQAAIDAVKQWRYKPYLVDGEPVEVDSRITINFTLSKA